MIVNEHNCKTYAQKLLKSKWKKKEVINGIKYACSSTQRIEIYVK